MTARRDGRMDEKREITAEHPDGEREVREFEGAAVGGRRIGAGSGRKCLRSQRPESTPKPNEEQNKRGIATGNSGGSSSQGLKN